MVSHNHGTRLADDDQQFTQVATTLLNVETVWNQHQADPALRQKLIQQRTVSLEVLQHDRRPNTYRPQTAQLTDEILHQMFQVAQQLGLNEEQALSLLSKAKQVSVPAEQVYWKERKAHLDSLLLLFQERMSLPADTSEENVIVKITNHLLQQGLITKLLQLIRDFSSRLDLLVDQRRRQMAEMAATSGMNSMDTTVDAGGNNRDVALKGVNMHIDFGCQQRQAAAELLFFIAYNFHWEISTELVPLIHLIRDLSNGDPQNAQLSPGLLPVNPHDVPSPYKHRDGTTDLQQQQHRDFMAYAGFGSQSSRQSQEEKNPFEWQKELVDQVWNSGGPQRLRCVSTLLMAVTVILDVPQSLLNRATSQSESHSDNHIAGLLTELHQVLFHEHWEYVPHIQGVLQAGFGLLLQATNNPATANPLSPRHSSSPFGSGGSTDTGASSSRYREAFRISLEQPANVKTLSFVRFSVLPALHIPARVAKDPSAPSCDVSEFLLQVLTDWSSKYFELLLQHNPPISRKSWLNDAAESLSLQRQNQNQQLEFQRAQGIRQQHKAIPSSVDLLTRPDCMDDLLALSCDVCELGPNYASLFWSKQDATIVISEVEKLRHADNSLFSGYVDLLASLALDAPEKVHGYLCGEGPMRGSKNSTTWTSVLKIVRYYVVSLLNKGSARTAPEDTEQSNQSTAYYTVDDNMGSGSSMGDTRTKSSSSSSRASELGQDNTLILSSHLRLIDVVARQSGEARAYLRKLTLPINNGGMNNGINFTMESTAVGTDSLWRILFMLASTPISPELRGLTFHSLSSTMKGSTLDEIRQAWELVEDSGILPIYKLLNGFPTPIVEGTAPRIAFPPSSMSRVKEKHCRSWIKANPIYSLLYEMEYIEASLGFYPSTCGFLHLLRELIQAGGCPVDLGKSWRARTGCAPYLEYVIDLVLPRATGTFGNLPSLPFRSSSDRSQLIAAALSVASACLRRYIVPEFSREQEPALSQSFSQGKKHALELLSLQSLVDCTVSDVEESEFFTFLYDFMDHLPAQISPDGAQTLQNQLIVPPGVPKPKSPGFLILAEILNRTDGPLQKVLHTLLQEDVGLPDDVDKYLLSMAVYGAVPPTMSSAKAGSNYLLKNLLLPLKIMDGTSVDIAASHCKSCSQSLLEILCSAATREKSFVLALEAYKGAGDCLPVVKFQERPSTPTLKKIQASQISQLFCGRKEMETIVAFVGHLADDEVAVLQAAMGLLFYFETVSKSSLLPEGYIVPALARRLRHLAQRSNGENDETELLRTLLTRSLTSLRSPQASSYFLGIPGLLDGMESVLDILGMLDLLKCAPELVAMGYEILVEAMKFAPIAENLSRRGFWTSHLPKLVSLVASSRSNADRTEFDEIHLWLPIRWVLAGLAEELYFLSATPYNGLPITATGVNGPTAYKRIVNLVVEDGMLVDMVLGMPLSSRVPASNIDVSELVSDSIQLLVGTVATSSIEFRSNFVTSEIIQALLERLSQTSNPSTLKNLALATFAAIDFNLKTQEQEPQTYLKDVASLIPKGGPGGLIAAMTVSNILLMDQHETFIGELISPENLRSVASLLLRISCNTTEHAPVQPTPDAELARVCLKSMLPLMDEADVRTILQTDAVATWVKLVERLDRNIISLLQQIPGFEFGSDMLLKNGILRSIENAGSQFMRHVKAVASGSLESIQRVVPNYFGGHLDLMSTLLMRASRNRQTEAAHHVLEILRCYEPITNKMLLSFPFDGDMVVSFVRCCSVAVTLAASSHFSTPSMSIEIPGHAYLSKLALKLSEYPLPSVFLRRIPEYLKGKSDRLKSSVASFAPAPEEFEPWWDKLDCKDWRNEEEQLYHNGMLAAEIARCGLSLLRDGDILAKLDCAQIGRAVCRNVDALKLLSNTRHDDRHDDRLARQRMKLTGLIRANVLELLIVATEHLKVTRDMYNLSSNPVAKWEEGTRPLKIALDETQLDSLGILSRKKQHDENRGDSMDPIMNQAIALRDCLVIPQEMIQGRSQHQVW